MRPEQSVVRGSVVCHEQMEPLRGQINLSEVTDYTSVNFTSDRSFSPSSSIQNTDQSSSTRRTPENSHNGRDNDIFSNIVFRDSAVLANSDCRESEPLIPNTPNPTLTSLDIAALRKNLSGRPRLRRICHICGRECPSRHKLQRHLSTHSEERPYNCKVCGKAFKWTEYLSKHMRTQHGSSSTDASKSCITTIRNTDSIVSYDLVSSNSSSTTCMHPVKRHSSSSSTSSSIVSDISHENKLFKGSENTASNLSGAHPYSTSNTFSSGLNNENYNGNPEPVSTQQSTGSSTPLMSDQLNQSYSGTYFPNNFSSIPYPSFPVNCYGYPTGNPAEPYAVSAHPITLNGIFSFDSSYPSFISPQSMNDSHGIGTDTSLLQSTSPSCVFESCNDLKISNASSSVSCQTLESVDIGINVPARRSSVKIINLCTKKDVGIQCEMGDETLQALFEEEHHAAFFSNHCLSINPLTRHGFGEDNSAKKCDDGPSCVSKYPCEYNGCTRAYVHRKDLVRHMKVAHSVLPKVLEPRIIEAPAKPFVCQVGDCDKSYYHLKDLRRHQRQCHLVCISPLDATVTVDTEETSSSLRYPCDFKGCAKSYIHKKDLIRHKRMFHHDNSAHPSIPDPVIVIHVKKGCFSENHNEESCNKGEKEVSTNRFRLGSSVEPINNAHLPVSNQPNALELTEEGDLASLSASTIMDNLSAAVANIADMEDLSPHIFPLTNNLSSSVTPDPTLQFINIPPPIVSAPIPLVRSNTFPYSPSSSSNAYVITSSPSSVSMALLSQNI